MYWEHIRNLGILSFTGVMICIIAGVPRVFASATDGTIDATNRYAWSENTGWIDFGSTEGNVHVSDTALSGYAWGENVGWISFNCSNDSSCATVDFKVTNNGEGTLGGYAWSENKGWIDFDPTGGGVVISSSGIFAGYAWGENVGWISFNCSDASSCATVDYKVSSDWRPSSTRTTSSSSSSSQAQSGGGGGGFSGRPAQMAARIAQARVTILARFEGTKRESDRLATGEKEPDESAKKLTALQQKEKREEQAAEQREDRIAKRIATYEASVALAMKQKEEFQRKYEQHYEERYARAIALEQKHAADAQAALEEEQRALEEEQKKNAESREQRLAERKAQEGQAQASLQVPAARSGLSSLEKVAARRGMLFALVGDVSIIFGDVSLDEWYAPYVSYVIEEKITTGYADEAGNPKGEFGVGNPITYAEMLKMVLLTSNQVFDLRGLPPPRNTSAKGTWASAYVAQAEATQLSVFPPNLDVTKSATRGAVIQTLLEVLGIPIGPKMETPYSDVPVLHPYARAIAMATYLGLVSGDEDASGNSLNRFRPDAPINRAEVAKIIALAKELLK